jgi:hypothetical protein
MVFDEARDGDDLYPPPIQVDHRDEGIHERDLESTRRAPNHEPILAGPGTHCLDHPEFVTHLVEDGKADQLLWPVFALHQRAALSDGDLPTSDLLGFLAIGDVLE